MKYTSIYSSIPSPDSGSAQIPPEFPEEGDDDSSAFLPTTTANYIPMRHLNNIDNVFHHNMNTDVTSSTSSAEAAGTGENGLYEVS